jgi:hypothetical protein
VSVRREVAWRIVPSGFAQKRNLLFRQS